MSVTEIFLIGVGLSMDAFAVSVCKGLSLKEANIRYNITAGLWFGFFQALMPFIGFIAGSAFSNMISGIDHWVAFILLSFIGGKMIWEAVRGDGDGDVSCKTDQFKSSLMFPAAVATSIDALAVGVSFAFLKVNIGFACGLIGVTTFVLAAFGVTAGRLFGVRFKGPSEIVGGIVLMIIGVRILISHLFFGG